MNIRLFLTIIVSFCLLSCGQKEPFIDAPPHSGTEEATGGPGTKNWTTTEISPGLELHKFLGTDPATNKESRVFVLDIDMNNSRYGLGFTCQPGTDGRATTSQAQIRSGAVAAVNATYERGSVYIKVGGTVHANLVNPLISNEVPNWKSEAAAFISADGVLTLEHSGKGKDLAAQRTYYRGHTCPNIITSAPMLIDNYEPVGESFVPVNLTESQFEAQYHYEHPYRHQGVSHPRTAIAKTEDNHVLLVVIDGRDGIYSGMSAKQVTKFLAFHFNPSYALNMDGGGSTAMSINGTVVNKPSGGEERAVPTHIVVYDSQKK